MMTRCPEDCAELTAVRAQLAAAKLDAQNAAVSKERFLANMNHELRTPLNVILGFSEVLLSDAYGALAGKHREYVELIHEGGRRLSAMLDNVLEIAKIEAGKVDIRNDRIDLRALVSSALQLVRPEAEKNHLRIEVEGVEGLTVTADERALRRAVVHLLSNAVKFTQAGGHVTISASVDRATGLALKITDTGIGLNEADLPRLMKPFTQASDDLARIYEGGGLGLPIANALIGLHDGSLHISSKVGVGTVVTVTLPPHRVGGGLDVDDATVPDFTLELQAGASFASHLVLEFEGARVKVFEGSGNCLLGRNRDGADKIRCDIVVNDQRVSRPHALVRFKDDGFYLTDQSRRGTVVVDGEGPRRLRENEPLRLGGAGEIFLGMEPGSADARPIRFAVVGERG